VTLLAIRGRAGGDAEEASTRRSKRSWLVPLAVASAAAVVAPRIPPIRRAMDTVVRCGSGDLFTTLWFGPGSFKALRFGKSRFQWCPVGHHLAVIRRVDESTLSPEELAEARAHHDLLIV